jgi:hypothetical protein
MRELLSVNGLAQLLDISDQLVTSLASDGVFETFATVDGKHHERLFESARTGEFERKLNAYWASDAGKWSAHVEAQARLVRHGDPAWRRAVYNARGERVR